MQNGTRKDSITGRFMPNLGSHVPQKRDSLHGAGLGFQRDKRQSPLAPDEMDDIEILEKLIHERSDFDWDKYAREREQSVYVKQNRRRKQPSTLRNNKDFEKYRTQGGYAIEKQEIGSIPGSEVDEEDLKSVVSILDEEDGDNYFQELISQISTDAKAKLKFIIEFAASKKQMSKASSKIMRELDPNDLVRLRKSIIKTRLGRDQHRTRPNRKQNSTFSKRSESVFEERPTNLEPQTPNRRVISKPRSRCGDDFAKYKGFKDAETMRKHLERVRGFEELRNETQIDLMARENGYRPARVGRMQSVLNYLDPSLDKTKTVEADEDDMEKAIEDLKNNAADSDLSEDDSLASDFESESDYDSDVYKFMDLSGDDGDLGMLAQQWENVSFDNPLEGKGNNTGKELTASGTNRAKKKERMRKRAIRRGWNRAKEDQENDFVHRKLRPYDSLTTRHMKELQIAEDNIAGFSE